MAQMNRMAVLLWVSAASCLPTALVRAECVLPPDDARFVESSLGTTGKMRYVKHMDDFRSYRDDFGDDFTVNLFYMESAVSGKNGELTVVIAEAFKQYHSGIRGEIILNGEVKATFVLEFWGMGKSTVAPYCVDENGPKWQYDTVIVFTDGWDQSKWFGHRTEGFQVASLPNGESLNQLFEFVYREWATNPMKRKYMQWQHWVREQPGADARHTNYDLICDSFTESLIWHVPTIGGSFHTPTLMIRRNYGVILSQQVEERKADDPEVISFFTNVLKQGQVAYMEANVLYNPVFIWDQFRNRYLKLSNPRGGIWVYVKYTDMPLPPEYYQTCHRQKILGSCPAGTCLWESLSGNLDHVLGRYCKGKEEPALLDLQALDGGNTSPFKMSGTAFVIAAVAATSTIAATVKYFGPRVRLQQQPLLG